MAGDCLAVPSLPDASGNKSGNKSIDYATDTFRERVEQWETARITPVPGDPNLDPFYLEKSLETTRAWECYTLDETDVEFDDLENEYLMLYMTEPSPISPDYHDQPAHVQGEQYPARSIQTRLYGASSHLQRTANYSQSSCSSIRTDATGLTPELTPSSSFSSASSVSNCPETVRLATEQLAYYTGRLHQRERAPRFYLPSATPDIQSRACTRPSTPINGTGSEGPEAESNSQSSATPTMVPREIGGPAASPLRLKPLPFPPPLTTNGGVPVPQKKSSTPGLKTQINPSAISPPSLMNPVTMEPHRSPFDHAVFISSHNCSPVPNPAAGTSIDRRRTDASTKGRVSTTTSVAHGEQSVWESDSDSESITRTSQLRRGPIDTLRKVRSRVQLRRIAKSEGRLHADIHNASPIRPGSDDAAAPRQRAYPQAARSAAGITLAPDLFPRPSKQTLRLVAPSMTSLTQPQPQRSSCHGDQAIDTSTAAAIQAQSRRRQKSNATDDFDIMFKGEGDDRSYCQSPPTESWSTNTHLGLGRPGMLKRLWKSVQSLNCGGN